MTTTQVETLPKLDITAELDLKVSTRDIIEMIAEERRAQLESHKEGLQRVAAQAEKRIDRCFKDMRKRALALGKQRLRHLAKLVTEDPEYTLDCMYDSRSYNYDRNYKAAKGLLNGMSRAKAWTSVVERRLRPTQRKSPRRYESNTLPPTLVGVPYAVEFNHKDSDRCHTGDETFVRIDANWRLPDVWYRGTNQYIKDFVAAVTDYDSALLGVEAADRELADLDKKSRRAKAKLVRELLQSSPQGRKLLSSMGASSKHVLGALHSGVLA